jgi:two-component system, sensor histidine kinase and response regulator
VTAPAPLILVADDVPANVELLCDQLTTLGYRTAAAYDAPSALAAAFAERPDLCILDVAMPAGTLTPDDRSAGFEVCRRIKRDPRTKHLPVIFVSALNEAADRIKAIEAGGDDFLTKPHNRLVLGARIRSLLKLSAAADALEEAVRKQRELQMVRDDLMKMIVHDLKTPLTTVIATLEMIVDGDFGPLGDRQRHALVEAEGRAEDLLALIEDLLEVTRIEAGSLSITPTPIAPAAFLAEMVYDWQHRFTQEGASAEIEVSDDAPVFEADKALLKRVFANLLQNALTHSPLGVQVRLSARRDGDGILFTVADNGPGIAREYHELIFRKFEQVRTPNAPKTRSSGLGLAFCRLVAEGHGGRIWVASELGAGAQFHLALPAVPSPVAAMRREGSSAL